MNSAVRAVPRLARAETGWHPRWQTPMTIGKETDVSDSIEDEKDDDAYDFTPPPGPSPREVRRRWVEEGNVGAFLDCRRSRPIVASRA